MKWLELLNDFFLTEVRINRTIWKRTCFSLAEFHPEGGVDRAMVAVATQVSCTSTSRLISTNLFNPKFTSLANLKTFVFHFFSKANDHIQKINHLLNFSSPAWCSHVRTSFHSSDVLPFEWLSSRHDNKQSNYEAVPISYSQSLSGNHWYATLTREVKIHKLSKTSVNHYFSLTLKAFKMVDHFSLTFPRSQWIIYFS